MYKRIIAALCSISIIAVLLPVTVGAAIDESVDKALRGEGSSAVVRYSLNFSEADTMDKIRTVVAERGGAMHYSSQSPILDKTVGKSAPACRFSAGGQGLKLLNFGITSGIVSVEGDFLLDASTVGRSIMDFRVNGSSWLQGFKVAAGGYIHTGGGVSDIAANGSDWHKLKFAFRIGSDTVNYYIDDKFIGAATLSFAINTFEVVEISQSGAGTMILDNFCVKEYIENNNIDTAADRLPVNNILTVDFSEGNTLDKLQEVKGSDSFMPQNIQDSTRVESETLRIESRPGLNSDQSLKLMSELASGVISIEGHFRFDTLPEEENDVGIFNAHIGMENHSDNWYIAGFGLSVKNSGGESYIKCLGANVGDPVVAGKWYNLKIMFAVDGNKVNYYINGAKVAENTLAGAITHFNRCEVTQKNPNGSASLLMYFDDFKLIDYGNPSVFETLPDRAPAFSQRPDAEKIAGDFLLGGTHPRLMATKADFDALKAEYDGGTNPAKKEWYALLIERANVLLNCAAPVYSLNNEMSTLLNTSSNFQNEMITLAMAYRLTWRTEYLDKAREDLLAVAAFSDWHPQHHLDTSIMAAGFAIGYDWLYEYLSDEDRAALEASAKKNGLDYILLSYQTPSSVMTNAAYVDANHNAMCNGGAMLAALAFYDAYPRECALIVSGAVRGMEEMMWRYAPDGVWFEGTMYGGICVDYLSMAFSAMEKCFNTQYGLDEAEGFNKSYEYIKNMQADAGTYNYGDCDRLKNVIVANGWLSGHFGGDSSSNLINKDGSCVSNGEHIALSILWSSGEKAYNAPRDVFYSKNDVLAMRDDCDETFVGIKAGKTLEDHSQLDSGSFVFDSQGVRWAYEMGKDSYALPGYFDVAGGGRWKIFLNRAEAHNTVVISPDIEPDYVVGSTAKITDFDGNDNGAIAKVDMSALLASKASSAARAYCFTDGRKSLVVRDELTLRGENDIYWLMYTQSDISIDNENKRAILSDKVNPEKKLYVDFLCSRDAQITSEDAQEFVSRGVSGQRTNSGYKRLMLKTTADGAVNITVKLTPVNISGSGVEEYDLPISEWGKSLIKTSSAALEYLGSTLADRTERVTAQICDADFESGADISDADTSMIKTRQYNDKIHPDNRVYWYDYAMTPLGISDTVVVEQQGDNRVCHIRTIDSKYKNGRGESLAASFTDTTYQRAEKAKGGVLRYSAKLMFPDFNANKLIDIKFLNSGASVWENITINTEGNLSLAGSDTGVTLTRGTWYDLRLYIDIDNKSISLYVDGSYCGEHIIDKDYTSFEYISINTPKPVTGLSEIYLDDFKCERLEIPREKSWFWSDGETVRAYSVDSDVIFAAYADGAMTDCRICKNSGGKAFYDYSPGNADSIKAMAWNAENMKPTSLFAAVGRNK